MLDCRIELFHELLDAVVDLVQVSTELDHDVRRTDTFLNLVVTQPSEP